MECREKEAKGLIFDIQRYCIHDGPGVRSVVFLKGCPMRCAWCSNPESIGFQPELMFFETTCMACGRCVEACPHQALTMEFDNISVDRRRCDCCGECSKVCPTESIQIRGNYKRISKVIDELYRDKPFYNNSGGGVTLSGGEPSAQPGFSRILLDELKRLGIHTALETNGCTEWNNFKRVAEAADLILFDLKHLDPQVHVQYTGIPNHTIIQNLKRLARLDKPIIIRIPVIPGINDGTDHMIEVIRFIKNFGDAINRLDLLPYHRLGVLKYKRLGMPYPFNGIQAPSSEKMQELEGLLREHNLKTRIGG